MFVGTPNNKFHQEVSKHIIDYIVLFCPQKNLDLNFSFVILNTCFNFFKLFKFPYAPEIIDIQRTYHSS